MSTLTPIAQRTLPSLRTFRNDVVGGLDEPVRNLPAKYFYDDVGSKLFDQICELDEYYPTRTETQIMEEYSGEIADQIGSEVRLIEYGSGSSLKTRILLDHLHDPTGYVPVDISADHLVAAAEELAREYPLLNVSPVVADFTKPFELPDARVGTSQHCIYFPGSTLGNFEPCEATRLLKSMADHVDSDGQLLIGIDLQKEVGVLEAAYNDRHGVTAAFNKNLLARINRELGGDFDLDQFEHLAFYNRVAGRIEMHLVSKREQRVTIDGQHFPFGWGETICTEHSYKYTIDGFCSMAADAGWNRREIWCDPNQYFAVALLER